jgi:hypothetical protein
MYTFGFYPTPSPINEGGVIMNKVFIAEVAHEINRVYCASLGDDSQPAWDDAPQWQRDSAIVGVGYLIDNPTALPEDSHNSWLAHKENDGWRYGPVKDPERKEHPCFVPYDQLPEQQQAKDDFFHTIVNLLK